MNHKNSMLAKARSPNPDINSIPEIYDKTQKAMNYIDNLSGHDPTVSKAIASCTTIGFYTRESEVDDPYLIKDEIIIDHVNNMYQMSEMLDDGTWESGDHQCPHAKDCGNSSCDTCLFAQLKTVNIKRLRSSLSLNVEMIPLNLRPRTFMNRSGNHHHIVH